MKMGWRKRKKRISRVNNDVSQHNVLLYTLIIFYFLCVLIKKDES